MSNEIKETHHYEFLGQRKIYGWPEIDLKIRVREKLHVTKQDIKNCLYELGLRKGSDVGVHSSLNSLGYVEGGADAVIDALLETVGEQGTIVMPTYSTNKRLLEVSEAERKNGVTYKEEYLPYNPKETSCWTGKIADTFWRRKDAIRSSSQTHSLAAIGAKADELSQKWDKLLEVDGHILLIGVNLGNCSAMHFAERYVQLPEYILKGLEPPEVLKEMIDKCAKEGIRVGYKSPCHYPDFSKMEEPCKEHGIMRVRQIGEGTLKLFLLREAIDLYAEHLRKNPDIFYYY